MTHWRFSTLLSVTFKYNKSWAAWIIIYIWFKSWSLFLTLLICPPQSKFLLLPDWTTMTSSIRSCLKSTSETSICATQVKICFKNGKECMRVPSLLFKNAHIFPQSTGQSSFKPTVQLFWSVCVMAMMSAYWLVPVTSEFPTQSLEGFFFKTSIKWRISTCLYLNTCPSLEIWKSQTVCLMQKEKVKTLGNPAFDFLLITTSCKAGVILCAMNPLWLPEKNMFHLLSSPDHLSLSLCKCTGCCPSYSALHDCTVHLSL